MKYLKVLREEQYIIEKNILYYDAINNCILSKRPSLRIIQTDNNIIEYYDLDKITNELILSIPNIKSAWINCPVVGNAAFYNNQTIESVYLTNKVEEFEGKTVIQKGQFENCSKLKDVKINSVIKFSDGAFVGTAVENIILPNGLTSITDCMFMWCDKLNSIYVPDSVTYIGLWAFQKAKFTSINIPNGITAIKEGTFNECVNLKSVVIPDGVKTIDDYAFEKCSSLTSITIPNSVTSIGNWAFCKCSSLTSVTYNGTITQWNSITKGVNWHGSVPSTCIVHCTDGDIKI